MGFCNKGERLVSSLSTTWKRRDFIAEKQGKVGTSGWKVTKRVV